MPKRWTQYDEDDYRLPEGMKRVGYDADVGRYYFCDRGGNLYQGPQHSRYGHFTVVNDVPAVCRPLATDNGSSPRAWKYSPYRPLLPFLLIILTIVIALPLVLGLVHFHKAAPKITCPTETPPYLIKSGDSCWKLSTVHGCSLETIKELNPTVNCTSLLPGKWLCLPPATSV